MGLILLMGFGLADLNQMAKGGKERREAEGKASVRIVAPIPRSRDSQVRAIRFFLQKFPETASQRIERYPDSSVVLALTQLLKEEKDPGRRRLYLKLLGERKRVIKPDPLPTSRPALKK